MTSSWPRRGQQATGPAARIGAVVGAIAASVQLLKPIPALGTGGSSVFFSLMEASLGVAGLATIVAGRRTPFRSGGLLALFAIVAVLWDAGGQGAPPRMLPAALMLTAGVLLVYAGQRPPAGSLAGNDGPGARGRGCLVGTVAWMGVVGQLVIAVPFLAIGLVAPAWAVAMLFAIWAGMLALALHLRHRQPLLTPLVPAATFAIMLALLRVGRTTLNWVA